MVLMFQKGVPGSNVSKKVCLIYKERTRKMSITVSVTNWLVSNTTYGIHLKMVIWKFECVPLVPPNSFFFLVLDFNPDFVLC